MRITQKVSLVLGIAFVALCALLWAALQIFVAPQFKTFELEKAQDNFERAYNVIDRELNQLEAYRRDYGVWDAAYNFLTGAYPTFLDEELPVSLLQELGLNIYIYLGADGAVIDGVAVDGAMKSEVATETYAPVRFKTWKGFQEQLAPDSGAQTIVATRAGLMLIAYAPVTHTDGSGDFVGHLATGRLLDADFIAALSKQTRVELDIVPISEADSVAAFSEKSIKRADGIVTVAAPLRGVDGEPIAMLSARTPSEITMIGQQTLLSAFAWLAFVILLFIAIVNFLLQKLAVRPLKHLTSIMKSAGTEKPPIDAELARHKDEVGILYASFNNLLGRIDKHTQELASALQSAETAERAKAHFLANMSHEIRTPMNGVMGMAELLASTNLSDTQKSFVKVINKSGEALLTIINDILDFSKLDAGMATLNPEPFILADVVDDVSALVAPPAKAKNIELAVRIDPKLPESLVGDAGRLRQILINLVGNAVKFTDKGYVLIDVSPMSDPEEERVILKVSVIDTGIGIPEYKRADIFEKFNQADTSSTRAHEGTGLGLAIAKALVELMGGKIGVDSTPGAGSNFWFTIALPVNTENLPEDEEPPATVTGARLLIVDDNEVNRRILTEQAAFWGCETIACDNAAAALSQLRKAEEQGEPFAAVIMDYHMPGMNGAEAVKQIRSEPKIAATPVVLLTSVDQANAADAFESLGVNAHLTKPVRSAALQRAVGKVLHPGGAEDAHAEAIVNEETPAVKTQGNAVDVLVAEDNEVNRLVVSHILTSSGLSFEMAVNGRDAVEKYKSLKPKLILMDISMPEMNGYEATAAIRSLEASENRRTPIIGVTAHAVKGDREDCLDAGMDDYMPKPISPAKLTAKITEYLRAASTAA
ncbi:MAG: hypothetical protein CMI63_04165 [Parvularcula sp.]|nr:hypothetical protein [Parvularcula sp.]